MKRFNKSLLGIVDRDILKLPIIVIMVAAIILNFLIDYICDEIGKQYGLSLSDNVMPFKSVIQEFWMVVLLAPLLETLLFQYIPITLLKKIIPPTWIRIFISAILFGLSHLYNWLYIITAFIIGLVFGYVYVLSERKKYFPFLIIAIIHSGYNLTLFISKHYIQFI